MLNKKIKINLGRISFIMLGVFAVLLVTDLVTKACADKYIWEFNVIKGLIEVVPVRHNSGAAFSFLADKEWGQPLLIGVTVLMFLVVAAVFVILPERFIILKLSCSMILSGAMGNLIDRCMFLGESLAQRGVRDFVNVNMLGNWACCNFADFWIVFGVIIAIIDLLFFNEWAVFPLTKRAKAAQAERNKKEEQKNVQTDVDQDGSEDM